MTSPDPQDVAAVIARVRSDGSVMWSSGAMPGDFLAWRRRVRSAARQAGLRISVRRLNEIVFVEHLDHVVTDDQHSALTKVVGAQIEGQQITWHEALHQAGRDRIRAVPDEIIRPTPDDY